MPFRSRHLTATGDEGAYDPLIRIEYRLAPRQCTAIALIQKQQRHIGASVCERTACMGDALWVDRVTVKSGVYERICLHGRPVDPGRPKRIHS